MGALRIIRHSQASFLADDYDALSALGEKQARILGRHWLEQGPRIDRVIVGPRRRHRQTMEGVAAVYREAGKAFPEPEFLEDLDEHQGQSVVDRELPGFIDTRPEFSILRERTPENLRLYFRAFREITRRWVHRDLRNSNDLESWASFRHRVTRGLRRLIDETARGQQVAVFTSGGPVAVAAGLALELGDEKVLELSWRVRNTAYADLLFSEGAAALDTWNANPHLREPELITYI